MTVALPSSIRFVFALLCPVAHLATASALRTSFESLGTVSVGFPFTELPFGSLALAPAFTFAFALTFAFTPRKLWSSMTSL